MKAFLLLRPADRAPLLTAHAHVQYKFKMATMQVPSRPWDEVTLIVFAILNSLGFANTCSKHRETVDKHALLFLLNDKKSFEKVWLMF